MFSYGHRCGGCTTQTSTDDALEALDAAVTALAESPLDALGTGQRTAALCAITGVVRRLAGVENTLIAGLRREAIPAELAGSLPMHLATALHISTAEARRRVMDADDVGPRTALTGEPLPPRLPDTAAGVAAGTLDRGHVREIHRFFDRLPAQVSFASDRATKARWMRSDR